MRSRANPWFRPVVPIANALVDGIEADARYEERLGGTMVRALVRSRLSSKLIFQARLLDGEFDERVRELCPDLPPLDPVTTAELRRIRGLT